MLEKELARLRRTLDMGYGLRFEWKPDGSDTLDGEVRGAPSASTRRTLRRPCGPSNMSFSTTL